MLISPPDGKELQLINQSPNHADQMDMARRISYEEGGTDERFALKRYVEQSGWLKKGILKALLRDWFRFRNSTVPEYGPRLGWNECEL